MNSSNEDALESILETEDVSPVLQRWSRLALEVVEIRALNELDDEIVKANRQVTRDASLFSSLNDTLRLKQAGAKRFRGKPQKAREIEVRLRSDLKK